MLPSTTRPRLRLLPAPATEPPYDDERTDVAPTIDGALALAFPTSSAPLPLRLVPPAQPGEDSDVRSARADLPDPRQWTGRLAQAVVEVLAGQRPAAQLCRFATLDVLDLLERWAGRLARRTHGTPVSRPVVMSVHVSEPVDGVAEACVVMNTGVRRRAIALRLEGIDGRWQCTALQLG